MVPLTVRGDAAPGVFAAVPPGGRARQWAIACEASK